ncbi:hypothetical protein SAMN05443668_102287 [Cryptosporangium aurantiacum]|uniref:Uncharacterized protein n=1 Tax=Cryptosporangium aurantiacum TaxID=134849 RepID=A0A1M7MV25_9ACTN|nr:hypothetical protein SAMN05443668_102287 [Cryptosporangium aurantiacum]
MNGLRSAAAGVGFLLLFVPPPGAVDRITFHVRYFAEGGSHQTYLDARRGAGVAGEAWLDASEHDARRARTLTVCHRRPGDHPVRAVISVPDGRRISYSAPHRGGCYERILGYPFSRWQLAFGSRLSGSVPPPPLV